MLEATEFVGAERLRRVKADGPERKLVAFRMTDRAIPRQGMAVDGGGEVTSGSLSPMLDVGIGLAFVPAGAAAPGSTWMYRYRDGEETLLARW